MPLKNKSVLTVQSRGADFQLYSNQTHQEGEAVEIRLRRFHVFDPKTGERIASPQITD
jgi:hypothetical protein